MSKYDNAEYNKRWREKHYDVYVSNSLKSNTVKSIRDSELRISKIETKIELLGTNSTADELELKYVEYQVLRHKKKIEELQKNIETKKLKLENLKSTNTKNV